ncbi:MAG TPA: TIGR03842 family LLM class F420-dependent oxidoreductase [Acidimicrobiales bacterium]|nr:TIGR03842 family LLM class F420-dependent oxidoreductase [Acidimicrobiales bacterium]
MDFGLVAQTNAPARDVIELAKRAEDAGFSHFWTFDSVVLWQEPFVIYSQILSSTSHIKVGPMVTNPITRDWTVTASLFATLNEMFGPRTICGIGRGDSALRVTGGTPASLATLSSCMTVVRDLVEGRETIVNDRPVRIPWVDEGEFEIWMAAYGPKALELAGRKADGLILQLADPFVARWAIERAREAVRASGRSTEEYRVCVAAPAYVGDDLAHQRDQVRWFGGMVGNHVADIVERYGAESNMIPPALTDYIKGRKGYDYAHHGKTGNPDAEFVPDEIIERFCVLGPVEQHRERLGELGELGVDQFALYLMHDNPEGTIEAYRRHVIGKI